ncbi:fibronectin type III domain-containing protein [Chryseobacterium sp. S-02]|uniref:fibronectin type III domain-containing protein n=1 Tax=Chryseobacterium sp. S-02 TaxID=3404064 RepID=UPI003CEE3F5C
MRKHYLLWIILILPLFKLSGQTYCTPTTGGTSTANYLANATFSDQGAFYYTSTSYQAYINNSATHTVTSYPSGTVNVHLDFIGNTKANVWVDWNSDGDFDDFYENPIAPVSFSVVDAQLFVPPSQAPGIYRIRVQTGTSITTAPNPCGPNTSGNGNFVDFSLKIDPTPTCFVPTAVTASNITNVGATISWSAPSTPPSNGYEYYYTSSSAIPDATTTPSGSIAVTSAPINGLTPFTSYYVYVRSVCSTSNKSAWSLRGTFKTKCDPITSMSENFENPSVGPNSADCWDRIIVGTGTQSISTGSGISNSKAMYQFANGAANTVIAVLPSFSNVNAGTHWIRLKARVSSTAGVLDVGYVTNDTDASTFVNIQSLNISNTVYDGYEYNVIIPNTVPVNARLAIRHGGVPAVNIYWDNVYWEPKPTCSAPSNVILSNPTSSTVNVAWTAPSSVPAMGYDIYYSTSITPPDTTTIPNVTGATVNPYPLQGLNSATTYYVWVRSRCSGTDQSSWTNITSVLTLCAAQTSLFENFDTYNTGLITNAPCWGRLVTGIGSVNINSTGAYSGSRHIMQRPLGASSMAILPELSNINAGTHSLKFRAYCSTNAGVMKVGYVTNPADITSFVLIQTLNITNTSYAGASEYSVVIPNTVPATAKLAIFTDSGNLTYYWDDLSWAPTVALGVNEVSAKNDVAIYPNPFTDTISVSGDVQLQSVVVYDASGKRVKEVKGNERIISLHNLKSGMYLVKLIMKNGTFKTIKAVKK